MHPSTLLSALTIGLYSLYLVQGSSTGNTRRVNRLRSVLPVQEDVAEQRTETEPVVNASEPHTVQEITLFDALVDAASSATAIDIQIKTKKSLFKLLAKMFLFYPWRTAVQLFLIVFILRMKMLSVDTVVLV